MNVSKNLDSYQEKYHQGYGIRYPESHMIRFYNHILKYEFHLFKGNVFDFGCGNGMHLKYFHDQGFQVYGVDTNEKAVGEANVLLGHENAKVVSQFAPDLSAYHGETMDVIISNQVLYYLCDKDIKNLMIEFNKILKPGGVVLFTMMSDTNSYFRRVESVEGDMAKVVLKGRLKETTYINFKNKAEVLELFKIFPKRHLGFYSSIIREEEGNSDHHFYVGVKPI